MVFPFVLIYVCIAQKSAFVQAIINYNNNVIISTIDPLVCCENMSELNINQVQGVFIILL